MLLVAALLATVLLTAACSGNGSHYDGIGKNGYTVSVKYDANGGSFTTNTTVICDSYDLSQITTNGNGKKELFLISPDNPARRNAYTAKNSGYFLAGWYSVREAVVDDNGNHLDYYGNIAAESGNLPAYTYGGAWDFTNGTFEVDPNGSYSADTPVLTLYAAWVPEFSFEFYDMEGTLLETYKIDPLLSEGLTLPAWDMTTGKMNYNDFPAVSGMTFNKAYLSADKTGEITSATLRHAGVFDPASASYENNVMKVYIDYLEGDWYRISTADQLIANSNASANYIIEADLDFEGKSWPISGTFRGSIYGNGYTISNVSSRQSSMSDNAGLFKIIAESAHIENLNFVNATYALMKGSNKAGASFGLLAGTVKEGAVLTNVTLSGKITVSPDAKFSTTMYNFGLVCGLGYDYTGIDYSNITVEAIPDETALFVPIITVEDGYVTVEMQRNTSN